MLIEGLAPVTPAVTRPVIAGIAPSIAVGIASLMATGIITPHNGMAAG